MIWTPADMRLDRLDDRTLADIGVIRRDGGRALTYDVVEPRKPEKTSPPRFAAPWNLGR
jgi:hypothetical protein